MLLVLRIKFHPEILRVPPEWEGRQTREGWENQSFLALSVSISKTVGDTSKVTISD